MRLTHILILMLLTVFNTSYTKATNGIYTYTSMAPVSAGEIVEHSYFKLAYSEKHEQALWVYYLSSPDFFNPKIKRGDNFRPDPKVKTGSARPDDYKDSGTDRGHLCPAADMKKSDISVSESFYMSNMSPQLPGFNRGTWNKLESLVREWTTIEDSLFIVTGPVFKDNKGSIGLNKVTIPGYYYKVIFDPTKDLKMIAFLLRNSEEQQELETSTVSVDSIETLTGINFFPALPDSIENKLERKTTLSKWSFHPGEAANNLEEKETSNSKTEDNKQSFQCKGIAKSTGKRCKTITTNTNNYCSDHQNQVPNEAQVTTRCMAKTKDGSQCKRQAEEGSKYCFQHKP